MKLIMKKLVLLVCSLVFFQTGTSFAQVPNFVPTNGLVGWWPLDNSPLDTYTTNLGGSISGSLTSVAGHLGAANTAYDFNGSSYITVANHVSLSNYTNMSISLWVKMDGSSSIASLISKWYQNVGCNNLSDTYGVWINANTVNYTNINDVFTGFPSPPALNPLQLNAWTHVVCTSNSITGQKIYINAVLAASNTNGCLGSICQTTGPLTIGAETQQWTPPLHRYFTGSLDDIGIWNRELTECEIENLYKSSFMYTPTAFGATTISIASSSTAAGTTLTANSATIPGTASYQWYQPGSGTPFATTASVVVNPTIVTTYTVMVGKQGFCPGTKTITVNANEQSPVGISEEAEFNFQIGPNPVKDHLYLTFHEETPKHLRVYDASGKLILENSETARQMELDVNQWPKGVYLVELQFEKGVTLKRKVMLD